MAPSALRPAAQADPSLGLGAIRTGARASCCGSPRSRPTAAATWSRAAELTRDPAAAPAVPAARARRAAARRPVSRPRARSCSRRSPRRGRSRLRPNWLAPGERGLDDLQVEARGATSAARLPAPVREGRGARFAIYARRARRRSATRAVFARILRDEAFHMNYTLAAARRGSRRSARRAALEGAARPALEGLPAPRRRRSPALIGGGDADAPVLHPAAALRAAAPSARRGASRRAGRRRRAAPDAAQPAVLMKILGISAHYHDAAAALLVDGVPVAAVQEERLSRRKNDAAFPAGGDRMVPRARRARARGARRGGLLRAADAEVRAHPHHGAARLSRAPGAAFPNAMKNSLGEKLWVKGIIASHLGVPGEEDPLHRASPVARRGRLPDRADASAPRSSPPTASANGRRCRSAAASEARGGSERHRAAPRDPLPALARDALLDLHRLPRLRGQRGRVQGDGPGVVRRRRDSPTRCAR